MLIHEKIVAIQKEVKAIQKDKSGTGINYKFRGIDDVFNALHGLFKKHEVFILPKTKEYTTEHFERQGRNGTSTNFSARIVMQYELVAVDGSSCMMEVPAEGIDSLDKATNKAIANSIKYGLIILFLIPTDPTASGIADSDMHGADIKTDYTLAEVEKFIRLKKWDEPRKKSIYALCKKYGETYIKKVIDGEIQ